MRPCTSILRSFGRTRAGFQRAPALAIACVLASATTLLALSHPTRTYTEQDGLRSSWVTDIAQGSDGRMWFLTDRGVSVFDGAEWTDSVMRSGDPLQRGVGLDIAKDGTGWAVTSTGRFVQYDGASWSTLTEPVTQPKVHRVVTFAVVDPDGESTPAFGTNGAGLFWYRDGELHHDVDRDWMPQNKVHALLAVDDRLWVGTDNGLWSWKDGETEPIYLPDNGSTAVRGVARESGPHLPEGPRVWIASAGSISTWGADGIEPFARLPASIELGTFEQLLLSPDLRGGLYFGNEHGLFHVSGRRGQPRRIHAAPESGGVLSLFVDRESNLWITGRTGAIKNANLPFTNFSGEEELFSSGVYAVAQRESGELLLGHRTGITMWDGTSFHPLALPNPSERPEAFARVSDIEPDADGTAWLAVAGWGLAMVQPDLAVQWVYRAGEHDWVNSIRHDTEGRLWIARNDGIFQMQDRELVPVSVPALEPFIARRIIRTSQPGLYFATDGGVLRFDGSTWRQFGRDADPAMKNVFTIHEHIDGTILVGSQGGLLELSDAELVVPDDDTLPQIDRPVYFIVPDHEDRLWIGTDHGVYRWSAGEPLRHFTLDQGLSGLEMSRAAGFVDKGGRIWLGSDSGVSLYSSDSQPTVIAPPTLEILGLSSRGLPFDPSEGPLEHQSNDLSFDLRAISFVDESKISFLTRLEGLDPGWEEAISSTRLTVHYPRLPPGTYRLEARACNVLGDCGAVARSSSVIVLPPVWRRSWFLGLAALALALGGFAAQSFRYQRRHARVLAEEVRKRTVALEDSQQATRAERDRLKTILSSIDDGVLAVDESNRLLLWNPAAAALLGFTEADRLEAEQGAGVELEQVLERHDDETRRELVELVSRTREAGATLSRLIPLLAAPAPRRELDVAAGAYSADGREKTGVVLALRDVTEQRRLEEDRARVSRLEALGVLAGGIAHDFNNILTAVLGNVSLVRVDAPIGEQGMASLRAAEEAVERASRLAHRLITFSKGGAPTMGPASLGAMLEESLGFVFSGSAVRTTIDVSEELWLAEVDSDQVLQVFENLFWNARQAIDEPGHVHVRGSNVTVAPAGASSELPVGDYVRIDVVDDGRGIDPEDLGRVFDPYFTTKSHGSGLGLATSFSIVRRHGGDMRVRSTPGIGTTFSVFFPAALDGSSEPKVSAVPLDRVDSLKVLVLDDDPGVGDVLCRMLCQLGHVPTLARDGDEALELHHQSHRSGDRFQVAILDLTIPGGASGVEILGRLRERDPELIAIASSAYSATPARGSREQGFSAFLPKPYSLPQLARLLDSLIVSTTRTA